MSSSIDIECPNCRDVVVAEPEPSGARRATLRGERVACTCGHPIDVYFY
ncbi:hypothetical protein [Halomarina ordinaria]|uniref:Small CPxCG-related zinc finger protein n=1 Tax=Halomarina ordinaria TaxID=3033939 RepID=A0ABD5UF45_9EURY|nr:hypothetical protein [Halomarina sp. PSRA2]